MEWKDLWPLIVSTIVGGFIGFLVTWFMTSIQRKTENKIQENKEEKETKEAEHTAMMEACKESLRRALKEDLEFYKKQGYCSIEDKAEVQALYNLYHNEPFKGNGRGTGYFNGIIELPNEPHKEESEKIVQQHA